MNSVRAIVEFKGSSTSDQECVTPKLLCFGLGCRVFRKRFVDTL